MGDNAHWFDDLGARVWRGHFVCMALDAGLGGLVPIEFATVAVPEPGDVMRLIDGDGRVVLETDEVVASLVRHGRLYVRTRSETYRIIAADADALPGSTGEMRAIFDDEATG